MPTPNRFHTSSTVDGVTTYRAVLRPTQNGAVQMLHDTPTEQLGEDDVVFTVTEDRSRSKSPRRWTLDLLRSCINSIWGAVMEAHGSKPRKLVRGTFVRVSNPRRKGVFYATYQGEDGKLTYLERIKIPEMTRSVERLPSKYFRIAEIPLEIPGDDGILAHFAGRPIMSKMVERWLKAIPSFSPEFINYLAEKEVTKRSLSIEIGEAIFSRVTSQGFLARYALRLSWSALHEKEFKGVLERITDQEELFQLLKRLVTVEGNTTPSLASHTQHNRLLSILERMNQETLARIVIDEITSAHFTFGTAIEVIARLTDHGALQSILNQDGTHGEQAERLIAAAAEKIEDPLELEKLAESHLSPYVRKRALTRLSELAGTGDLDVYRRIIANDPDESVRKAAQAVLDHKTKSS